MDNNGTIDPGNGDQIDLGNTTKPSPTAVPLGPLPSTTHVVELTKVTPTMQELAETEKARAETELVRMNLRKASLEVDQLEYDASWRDVRPGTGKNLTPMEYPFVDEIKESTVTHCIEILSQWCRRSDAPVVIIINSPGGSISDGLALFDYLRTIGKSREVVTHAIGEAASMAAVLLQAGTTRRMSPNAYILIHEASWVAWGKASEIGDKHRLLERLQDRLVGILAERSTLTKEEIKDKWLRRDWWLDADEALGLGLIDQIG